MKNNLKFIDLFAGMGGFRLGFENACHLLNIKSECVFTSEIKPHALQVYTDNFPDSIIFGDITQIDTINIPNFDVLLAGFPCQSFSHAGKRQGFLDTRGTLFFEIERIIEAKQPPFFILENVEGLITHDKQNKADIIGKTLQIILAKLSNLGYQVSWQLFDSQYFGLAQSRKRIFIIGYKNQKINLDNFPIKKTKLKDILQTNQPILNSKLTQLLLTHFSLESLQGKSIKDKRGGKNNIHSWDIELKGKISSEQKALLNAILLARRNKKWAEIKGITWMDGMPLTQNEIASFYPHPNLKNLLDDLIIKNYLKYEYPKDLITLEENGKQKTVRQYRPDKAKGYNIVAGKLSYEINKILDPETITPTLVATDLDRIVVTDHLGLRKLTKIEQCRLFGFPDSFKLNIKESLIYDLFGNTVPVSVVTAIAQRMLEIGIFNQYTIKHSYQNNLSKPLQFTLLNY